MDFKHEYAPQERDESLEPTNPDFLQAVTQALQSHDIDDSSSISLKPEPEPCRNYSVSSSQPTEESESEPDRTEPDSTEPDSTEPDQGLSRTPNQSSHVVGLLIRDISTCVLPFHPRTPSPVSRSNENGHRLLLPPVNNMLLLHQVGTVKIGEVVRYTVTYTPSHDHILPSPEFLYLRIRNSSAIALRAAFVHGPYTLSVAAYPASYNPNEKFIHARTHGVPEFEPMLKAGGSWNCHLVVPDEIRQTAGTSVGQLGHNNADPPDDAHSVSWIIEVTSQIYFSTSAAVGYEILLGRDAKSLNISSGLSLPLGGGSSSQAALQPGKISDHQQSTVSKGGQHVTHPKGVFCRAMTIRVDDTASLWNTPRLPGYDDVEKEEVVAKDDNVSPTQGPVDRPKNIGEPEGWQGSPKRLKKVHLVLLTHGLHSNLGADMLFLKESIDIGVKKAKIDAKARKEKERAAREQNKNPKAPHIDMPPPREGDDDDDEEVIVRGFAGNATRTERGIKYLGKRLAKFILTMTYPDQPYLPVNKATSNTVKHHVSRAESSKESEQVQRGSTIHHYNTFSESAQDTNRAYRITSISFIAHSLGGLVQTYAVAYIQKHSPQFFDVIRPINFIAIASPFLGLSNENPLYVKFALDFGLVGRTGQDLGLTWRAPTIARSGWGAIVGNLGESAHKKVLGESRPESKPLLRILPTGPVHTALQKFRNRTVYSNVVNDGIVPLRTSCLLFLDWQGLGRVDKARREAGLVETVVGFGWAELTGANVTSPRNGRWQPAKDPEDSSDTTPETVTPSGHDRSHDVPLPPTNATLDDDTVSLRSFSTTPYQDKPGPGNNATGNETGPFSGFLSLFQKDNGHGNDNSGNNIPKPPPSPKINKIYHRSQTLKLEPSSAASNGGNGVNGNASGSGNGNGTPSSTTSSQTRVTTGHELADEIEGLSAPPRTTFFESAGDVLNPKLPSVEYLIDPANRPRTIFHDRVYHPTDIPPPPLKRRPTSSLGLTRRSFSRTVSGSSTATSNDNKTSTSSRASSPFRAPQREDSWNDYYDPNNAPSTNGAKSPSEPRAAATEIVDSANMKVEEKIARAYHRGLSWRKVLVKLEPDAHNNIMVRRMFANAFGWPVIKHLVDAHFSDEVAARMRDDDESGAERAQSLARGPTEDGTETMTTEDDKADLRLARQVEDGSPSPPLPSLISARGRGGPEEKGKTVQPVVQRTDSERREAEDCVGALRKAGDKTPSICMHSESLSPSRSGGDSSGGGFTNNNHSPLQEARQWRGAGTGASIEGGRVRARGGGGGGGGGGGRIGPSLRISAGGYVPPPSALISPVTSTLSGNASSPVFRGRVADGEEHEEEEEGGGGGATWSERDWADSGDDSDEDEDFVGMDSVIGGMMTPTMTVTGDASGGNEGVRTPGPSQVVIGEASDGSLPVGKEVASVGVMEKGASGVGGKDDISAIRGNSVGGNTGENKTPNNKEPIRANTSPLNALGLSGGGGWSWTDKIMGRKHGKSPVTTPTADGFSGSLSHAPSHREQQGTQQEQKKKQHYNTLKDKDV